MPAEQADLEGLLLALTNARVEFIVIGGTAAVLHGCPTTTLDLDIVPRLDPENLDSLQAVLSQLRATVRDPGQRQLFPDRAHLEAGGQLHLSTSLGPLDIIGRLNDGSRYEDLEPHTLVVEDGGLYVRIVDLETLIELKKSTGRTRDKLLVPILLALLDTREAGEK